MSSPPRSPSSPLGSTSGGATCEAGLAGGELTETELKSLKAPVLVELVLESREQKNALEQRCARLASALHQAQSSLETLEQQSYIVQVQCIMGAS